MKRGHRWLALGQAMLWSGITAACGGDSTGPSAASTSGSGGATVSVASSTSSGGGEGGGGGGSGGSGGSVGGGGHGGVGGDGGEAVACPELPPLPLVPEEVTRVFSGSEDFAFDGKGRIVAKRGPNLILFDATGQTVNFASLQGPVRGLRYRPDGFLVAARPELGAVVQISSTGDVTTYAINLAAPNGLYPDEAGNVWVTELAGDRIIRINPDASIDEIVSGAPFVSKPNGVVFDGARQALFYTNYAAGEIRRLDMAARGEPPVVVSEIEGAALDGLALDACGNLYVVDGPGMKLYRVRLDRRGDAAGDPELIASFPTGVESVQFGVGPGFAAESLYAIGEAGVFYEVKVGVAGAPIPTPP